MEETKAPPRQTRVWRDPLNLAAVVIAAVVIVVGIHNTGGAIGYWNAMGLAAGTELFVGIAGAASVTAARNGTTALAARRIMWSMPLAAVVANVAIYAGRPDFHWAQAMINALPAATSCAALELIAYRKRLDIAAEDGLPGLRRSAAVDIERRTIADRLSADQRDRDRRLQLREAELFFWIARYERKRGPSKWWAEHRVWGLLRSAALDDPARTQMMSATVDGALRTWIKGNGGAGALSRFASVAEVPGQPPVLPPSEADTGEDTGPIYLSDPDDTVPDNPPDNADTDDESAGQAPDGGEDNADQDQDVPDLVPTDWDDLIPLEPGAAEAVQTLLDRGLSGPDITRILTDLRPNWDKATIKRTVRRKTAAQKS